MTSLKRVRGDWTMRSARGDVTSTKLRQLRTSGIIPKTRWSTAAARYVVQPLWCIVVDVVVVDDDEVVVVVVVSYCCHCRCCRCTIILCSFVLLPETEKQEINNTTFGLNTHSRKRRIKTKFAADGSMIRQEGGEREWKDNRARMDARDDYGTGFQRT